MRELIALLFIVMRRWIQSALIPGRKGKKNDWPPVSALHEQRIGRIGKETNMRRWVTIMGDSHAMLWDGEEERKLLSVPHHNLGIGGDTTIDWLEVVPFAVECQPSVVVVSIGSNNVGWGTPRAIESIVPHITRACAALLKTTDASIVICGIFPVAQSLPANVAGGRTPQAVIRANNAVYDAAKRMSIRYPGRVFHLGVPPTVLTYDRLWLDEKFSRDGAHLNLEGYREWSHTLNSVLDTILKLREGA